MSYLSRLTGEITIDPPPMARLLADNEFFFNASWVSGRPIRLQTSQSTEEVDEGTLVRRTVTAIVPAGEGRLNTGDVTEQLTRLVDAIRAVGGVCNGYLVRTGEDPIDMERYVVANNTVTVEKAVITWPDGTPVESTW